jgi:hypothetical protein
MNLKQIKSIHCLQGKNVSYGIIKETVPGRKTESPSREMQMLSPDYAKSEMRQSKKVPITKLKLGLYIKGVRNYFDFQNFRFYTMVNLPEIRREIVPARKYRKNGELLFVADDGTELVLPGDYLENIYRNKIYTSEMDDMILL